MRALRLGPACFALAVVLATAGCDVVGPSDKDKQDVVKQAATACNDLNDRLAKLVRPIELSETAIFYEQVAGYIDTTLEKLDAFDPPDADLPDWNEFYGGVRQQRDLIREAADAALDGRQKRVNEAERELGLIHARTGLAADKYGIEAECIKLPT